MKLQNFSVLFFAGLVLIYAAPAEEKKTVEDKTQEKRGLDGLIDLGYEISSFDDEGDHSDFGSYGGLNLRKGINLKPRIKSITTYKITKVPVLHPVAVPYEKKVAVPVPVKVPYPVEKPRPVPVIKPYPVKVEKPVPYPVEKKVPYPVEVPVKIPVLYPVGVPVPKPAPYPVIKELPYPVKVPVVIEKKVPVFIKASHHHSDLGDHDGLNSGLGSGLDGGHGDYDSSFNFHHY